MTTAERPPATAVVKFRVEYAASLFACGRGWFVGFFPSVTCGTLSTAMGAGLSLATSGIAAAFTIQARDNNGNQKTSTTDIFVVRARRWSDTTRSRTSVALCRL